MNMITKKSLRPASIVLFIVFAISLLPLGACDDEWLKKSIVLGASPTPTASPASEETPTPTPTESPTPTATDTPLDDSDAQTGTPSSSPTPSSPTPTLTALNLLSSTLSTSTDSSGRASISFSVPSGVTKFSVSVFAPDSGYVKFAEAVTGDGANLLNPNSVSLSLGGSLAHYVNEISVPSRDADPAVSPYPATYLMTAEASANASATPLPGKNLTFAINGKADSDLTIGSLRVNLFYVGTLGASQSTKDTVRLAAERFKDIYSGQAGIVLDIVEKNIDGNPLLPDPYVGDAFYRSASWGVTMPAVNIFIGGDIDGGSSGVTTYGVSAGIPGPPVPSERSAVAISYYAGGGPTGTYSTEAIRMLGETMAHETGHYLGLFHPVTIFGDDVSAFDPLSDTAECSSRSNCLANSSLTTNLMFPSPVSDGSGGYVLQGGITPQQRAVINRYIAVD